MAPKLLVPDGVETLCYLPDATQSAESIREQLVAALESGVRPQAIPKSAVRRTVILPASIAKRLRTLGESQVPPLSIGKTVCGLLTAVAKRMPTPSRGLPDDIEETLAMADLRPEQLSVLRKAVPLLRAGRLVMAEVGTGLGKSRIAGVVADLMRSSDAVNPASPIPSEDQLGKYSDRAKRSAFRAVEVTWEREESDPTKARPAVIVSTPTVSNIVHLASELDALRDRGLLKNATLRVVLGRSQFVSPSRVLMVVEALKADVANLSDDDRSRLLRVAKWVEKGMPSGQCDATTRLKRFHANLFGLLDDLKELAPEDFPFEDVILARMDDEVESEAYVVAREDVFDADIILTTHHTVAWDNLQLLRGLTPALPRARCLIVDEAHLLEPIQSALASSNLSLFSLRIALRQERGGEALIGAASQVAQQLQQIGEELSLPPDPSTHAGRLWGRAYAGLVKLSEGIEALLTKNTKRRKGSDEDNDRDTRERRAQLRSAVTIIGSLGKGASGRLLFSPDLRYPSVTSGGGSVAGYLAGRWAVCDSALLLSGTLLIPSAQGLTPHVMRSRLALDPERTAVTTPVHAGWTIESPTVYLPSADAAIALAPPAAPFNGETAMHAWAGNVAQVISEHVASSAKGGTLLLMTGFERAELVADCLRDDLGERLVQQDRRRFKLLAARRAFETKYHAGERPVWIATGGAWTGLDLSDRDNLPQDDFLLTDLVIVALPYGMERSLSHHVRVDYRGFIVEKEQMLLTLIQGLGRLVRRQGLKHRRIWVLDGRLRLAQSRNSTSEALNYLGRYPKQKEFG